MRLDQPLVLGHQRQHGLAQGGLEQLHLVLVIEEDRALGAAGALRDVLEP